LGKFDRHDLFREVSFPGRPFGIVVASEGDLVHFLAADVVMLRDELGGDAHDVGFPFEEIQGHSFFDGAFLGVGNEVGADVKGLHHGVHKNLVLKAAPPPRAGDRVGNAGHVFRPPARTMSAMPHWIIIIPETTASMDDVQTRLMVTAVTLSGMPARSAPTRATFRASPGSRQQPKRTSSIMPGSMPALFDGLLHGNGGELCRMTVAQGASEGPYRGSASGNNDNIFHVNFPLSWCQSMIS
jgi:hypothetical protein